MSSTVADLYDPADVAFKPGDAGQRLMCAGCGQIEVGAYEPVCPECRKSLEQAGILKPNDQQRVPVGPDPLYDQAVAIVREHKKPSISLVQRHLKIGYNRAARLLESMEAAGIVGPMDSRGQRALLQD